MMALIFTPYPKRGTILKLRYVNVQETIEIKKLYKITVQKYFSGFSPIPLFWASKGDIENWSPKSEI